MKKIILSIMSIALISILCVGCESKKESATGVKDDDLIISKAALKRVHLPK